MDKRKGNRGESNNVQVRERDNNQRGKCAMEGK
jgi:hypothetical protein